MKNQKGITLIALVVTIIVLLILAGISIAMLTGENGIITNAQKAKSQNAYYGAEERMKLAYMAVRTEIAANTVADSSYNATYSSTQTNNVDGTDVPEKANLEALVKVVNEDLKKSATEYDEGWTAAVGSVTTKDEEAVITITYTDSSIDANSVKAGAPKYDGKVVGKIIVKPQTASFEFDK